MIGKDDKLCPEAASPIRPAALTSLDLVLFGVMAEGVVAHLQQFCSAPLDTSSPLECRHDVAPLSGAHLRLEIDSFFRKRYGAILPCCLDGRSGIAATDLGRQDANRDVTAGLQGDRTLDGILQLSNIPRPVE